MKKLLGFFCGMALLGAAEAKVVTYDFTITVQHITEMDHGANPVYVQSSTRPGALVSVGEQVHGTFSFNTETPLSVVYQPPVQANGTWLLYSDSVNYKNPIDAVFQNSGLHTTLPAGVKVNSTVQVADNATTFHNGDVFSLINSASYKGEIFTHNIELGDSTGAVFNSAAIPQALNFSQFNYGSYGFSRMSVDGLWVEVDGDISSLTLSPAPAVPEPSTYLMLGAGVLLLAWRRKARA
ncbi:PEP-CTERM sorting domain-containing protein [Rugamonas aquatica]|uniref:PEP-CTERM sorting domain-containing protein n=1 Tax=Rugamonas aquatica TaxID=2743357 RepID=A0A6A7N0V0_9BURK|nr:PEP-CTERM sorting domain-containing protein [Rugamonas aquatica]MQA38540.1 PEP-CTERM sorting domain-containing protein [Rugamonas aquatica]